MLAYSGSDSYWCHRTGRAPSGIGRSGTRSHPSALCLGVVSGHGAVVVQDLPVRAPHELDGLGRVDAAW